MRKHLTVQWLLVGSIVLLQGCAYRMPAPRAPFQLKLKVDSEIPTDYVVTLENAKGAPPPFAPFSPLAKTPPEGSPAADGQIIVMVPPMRGTCSVYLLDRIKVRGSKFTRYVVVVKTGSRIARRIAVTDVEKLPVDTQGYHIVSVK
jgi:hypothetical protein